VSECCGTGGGVGDEIVALKNVKSFSKTRIINELDFVLNGFDYL